MSVGDNSSPPRIYLESITPADLQPYWPLAAPVTDSLLTADTTGVYRDSGHLTASLNATGFQQAGIYAAAESLFPLGVGSIHEQPHAEIKVDILHPEVAGGQHASLDYKTVVARTLARLAAHAHDLMGVRTLAVDVMDNNQPFMKALAEVGFRQHLDRPDRFEVVECGPKGEVFSHSTTWELRRPEERQPNESAARSIELDEGWAVFSAFRRAVPMG